MNRNCARKVICIIVGCCVSLTLTAQMLDTLQDTYAARYRNERDMVDIMYQFLHKDIVKRLQQAKGNKKPLAVAAAPILEYTTATGITAGLAVSIAFSSHATGNTSNTSLVLPVIKYTEKKQFLLPIQSSLWTSGNRFNFIGDWRYLDYPQDNFGFGGHSTLTDKYIIAFRQIRFYELVLAKVKTNLYAGIGYQLDHHWNISESELAPSRITDFQRYGFTRLSTSSGLSVNLVYDSRKNQINPEAGSAYASLQFLSDKQFLGADQNWSSITLDVRKYIGLARHSILGFWMYNVFTVSGQPPYLDLPATGSDSYNNTGRGYELNRFTGKHMISLEAELRFPVTRNGLVGGVVFANAQSLSELGSNRFEVLSPSIGAGLRIKLNKFSATNICVDYGIGTRGSRGFAGNLGEVF